MSFLAADAGARRGVRRPVHSYHGRITAGIAQWHKLRSASLKTCAVLPQMRDSVAAFVRSVHSYHGRITEGIAQRLRDGHGLEQLPESVHIIHKSHSRMVSRFTNV